MMTSRNRRGNQIFENTTCNSEAYNDVYEQRSYDWHINRTYQYINSTFVQPNKPFFSQLLDIYVNTDPPYDEQYTQQNEIKRRNLRLRIYPGPENDYSIIAIEYCYTFDYYSPHTTYRRAQIVFINNKWCECKFVYGNGNGYYIFQTLYERQTILHFTFHSVNPRVNREYRYKGAFHMIVDQMRRTSPPYRPAPYRPFTPMNI